MSKIICPYCNKEITSNPFDSEESVNVEEERASAELHYDCPYCGHWFTAYVDAEFIGVEISYKKHWEEE